MINNIFKKSIGKLFPYTKVIQNNNFSQIEFKYDRYQAKENYVLDYAENVNNMQDLDVTFEQYISQIETNALDHWFRNK
jgi:hypothetical protein